MPERIQRRRTKGWRTPDGAVYVGRPSRWGNRYIIRRMPGEFWVLDSEQVTDEPCPDLLLVDIAPSRYLAAKKAVDLFAKALAAGKLRFSEDDVRRELRDRDLACWCQLPAPGEPDICHGAILLAIAAGEGR